MGALIELPCWGGPFDGETRSIREDQTQMRVVVPVIVPDQPGFGQRTLGYYQRRGLLNPALCWVELRDT